MGMRQELKNLKRKPKILLLGSGGLSIGQAGEFDYSGSQAVKALLEEGVEVVLVNPNIATVQTNPQPNLTVYLYPVDPDWVTKIIEKERPDGIIAGFGGQTALNCAVALEDLGILKKFNVLNLGTPIETLKLTEDRERFAQRMQEIDMPIPPSYAVSDLNSAREAADKIGFPVIVRAAFALGGLGSGFAYNRADLERIVENALAYSPQVLIEKSVKGWKEVEYEVMRDSEGNTITICNMENFDPLGIHTGDSIVVCPSQSLSDDDFQNLRNAAIKIINSVGVVGECNVQFALSPDTHDFYVIEVNARLSRSSALASKASGYPIAYIAAKVVLGFDLLELKNPVTGITYAFFEPALDYITVKVPRWDLTKFRGASRTLGSTMKSVGEVMSIGRNLPEALQKAFRMVTEDARGLSVRPFATFSNEELDECISNPTDVRFFAVIESVRRGNPIDKIHALSAIDKWFLMHIRQIVETEAQIISYFNPLLSKSSRENFVKDFEKSANEVQKEQWLNWKNRGFGDEQIAFLAVQNHPYQSQSQAEFNIGSRSLDIRRARIKAGVRPYVKKIDTTAAEYPSPSNYLYVSYNAQFDDPIEFGHSSPTALILGSGTYRIGTSVEFDWCAVSCSRTLQKNSWRSIILNCNPETVSTDYNSSDRLYFEEMSLERVLDIADFEKINGVIACMGGQLPNKLAMSLNKAGLKLLGHAPESIDMAEDRNKFSKLLDNLGIDQPQWISAKSLDECKDFIARVGYPVLIRPSYVLSGSAMEVAIDDESLDRCLQNACNLSQEHPVVVTSFIEGAREIELDGVALRGEILTSCVSEHIENAGVHSGDATMVVPAQRLYLETVRQVKQAGSAIIKALNLNGPFNIQFLAKNNHIKVIECNARAARSFPFVSKTVGLNFAEAATEVMLDQKPQIHRFAEDNLPHVGVKAPMFSFSRLAGVDPVLGVEMASTGEVGCIGSDFDQALILALLSSGIRSPKKAVLISSGTEHDKIKFLPAAKLLKNMGIKIYATEGSARHLRQHGIDAEILAWPDQVESLNAVQAIKEALVDMVINIPKNNLKGELDNDIKIRRSALQYGCPLLTNMEKAVALIFALHRNPHFLREHKLMPLPNYQ